MLGPGRASNARRRAETARPHLRTADPRPRPGPYPPRPAGATVEFPSRGRAAEIVAANGPSRSTRRAWPILLSVKAPPPSRPVHCGHRGRRPARCSSARREGAERTLERFRTPRLIPGTGFALPARWRRSLADAAAFRDTSARIRVVKGEWADPAGDEADVTANYLRLVASLAGRARPVAVATHDPDLAERALTLLLAADTPCEIEQLRGLPSRRTTAVARRLGVPVRVYVPFGPGWWPYALDKALARPYLPAWMIRDRLGRA